MDQKVNQALNSEHVTIFYYRDCPSGNHWKLLPIPT